MKKIRLMICLFISLLLLFGCGSIFSKKKDKDTATKQKTEKVEDSEPKPGDIKVIDGVEYIYARNRRYMLTPNEPEYVWIRKDQYSPGIIQSLVSSAQKKESDELKKRIAKLEEELKKKNIAPQIVYPTQLSALPTGFGFMQAFTPIPFTYPSPKMRRRVIILPIEDQTNYKDEHIGELATRRLISRLESTGAIICVEPSTLNISIENITDQNNMRLLNELYGIQAIIKGVLKDVYSSSSKIEGKETREISFAISRISLDVYNTETGVLLKQLSGRNPVSLSKESGDLSSEKAKIKAIDLAIEVVSEDLLKAILMLDWHARIASLDKDNIYINAGRLSGLEKGNILEVYSPGEQIVDEKTKIPLGKTRGKYKGELEISELFGVDASMAKVKKGGNFSPTDLVYVKE